jgi:hypothetical protein
MVKAYHCKKILRKKRRKKQTKIRGNGNHKIQNVKARELRIKE